jgi:hypothetical protein
MGGLPVHSPAVFAILSAMIILVNSSRPLIRRFADAMVPLLCLMTLVLVSENLFGALGLVRLSADNMISPLILLCLVLLTWVVAMRRERHWKQNRPGLCACTAGDSVPD